MPSNAYSANVCPDPILRRVVLGTGVVLAIGGVFLINALPVATLLRAAAVILWLSSTGRELHLLRRGWRDCHALRFSSDGSIHVFGSDRQWRAARLASGGILLRKTAWIRLEIEAPSGRRNVIAELLRGDCRTSADWRRLHVIWRHVGAPV